MFNSLPWERHEVIQTQDGAGKPGLGKSDTFNFYALALQTTSECLML